MTRRKKPRPVCEAVSLYEAKTHLSDLVEQAAQGREIIIAKSGKPNDPDVGPRVRAVSGAGRVG